MAYTLYFTDETKEPIVVEDLTLNNQTDLNFVGKNRPDYAVATGENFLHLLENFANISPPNNPIEGQFWYNTARNIMYVFDSTQWVEVGGLKKASTAPSAQQSQEGDLWVDAGTKQLYLFANGAWILVGPEYSGGSKTGIIGESVIDVNNNEYMIVKVFVSGELIAVFNAAQESNTIPYIRPRTRIPGFDVLYKGVTLKNATSGSQFKYYGTVEKAEALSIAGSTITADKFLRNDTSGSLSGNLRVKNDAGIYLGEEGTFNLRVLSGAGVISNLVADSDIQFKINSEGTTITPLTITSNGNLAITGDIENAGDIISAGQFIVADTETSSNASTGSIRTAGGIGVAGASYFGDAVVFNDDISVKNVIPSANTTYTLGTLSNKFKEVHATTVNASVLNVETVTGSNLTIQGNVDSASALANSTTFRITGDVVSNDIEYDGTANAGTGQFIQEFVTTLGSGLVATKTSLPQPDIDGADEILINHLGDELRKTTVSNLLGLVPTVPIGTIVPWAGDWANTATRPSGWLLCDGSEVSQTAYSELYVILGGSNSNYQQATQPTSGYFYLPDLRGRMVLGVDSMNNVVGNGGGAAGRVANNAASSVGAFGGSENKTIDVTNLPEHTHNFTTNGQQFYAYRDFNDGQTGNGISVTDSGTTTNGGQLLDNAGDTVDAQGNATNLSQPLNVLNPFMALNFIIYAGETS